MTRVVPLSLLLATCFGLATPLGWAEEPADAVILGDGTRVPCEVLAQVDRLVRVRIGKREYEFETGTLRRVEKAGKAALDGTLIYFASQMALQLKDPDARIRRAALAALRSLRTDARIYLESIAKTTKKEHPDVSAALERLLAEPQRGMQVRLNRMVEGARAALQLEDKQVAPMRAAFQAYFDALRSGTKRDEAMKTLREAASKVLTPKQLVRLGTWLENLRPRRQGQ